MNNTKTATKVWKGVTFYWSESLGWVTIPEDDEDTAWSA